MKKQDDNKILLAVQTALVAEVHPSMRAIFVEINEQIVRLIVYVNGAVNEEVAEDFDAAVVTQLVAFFPWPEHGDPEISFQFVQCDFPNKIPVIGKCVFALKDTHFVQAPNP